MGVLCDVYIADKKRAKKYSFRGDCDCSNSNDCTCWDEFSFETYDHIDSHRIYTHDFALLLSVLRGKKYRESVEKEFKFLVESENGPWIQKVPDDLPKLLAPATATELKSIADAWCHSLSDDGQFPVEKKLFLNYLKLFQKLCKKSIAKEQNMYLWTCL